MEHLPYKPGERVPLIVAFAREEGFCDGNYQVLTDKRPGRNNNPLDLEWNAETQSFGATSGDPRFAVFPDLETGWNAGRRWLSVKARYETVPTSLMYPKGRRLAHGYLGATIEEVVFRFAPTNENNSMSYLRNICAFSEITPDTILTTELLNEGPFDPTTEQSTGKSAGPGVQES